MSCRPRSRRAFVGGRLSGRRAMERRRSGEDLVRAGKVTAVVRPLLGETLAGLPPSETYADLDF